MKKIYIPIVILAVLFFTAPVQALTWHNMNQATLCWTAVTKYTSGDSIPATELIEYEVFITANADKSNPTSLGQNSDTCKLVTLVNEGKFYSGVRAVRIVDQEVVATSTISWSDDSAVVKDGETFGLQHYLVPEVPIDLFRQQ